MPSLRHRSFIIKHGRKPWYTNQSAVSVWSGSTDPSWNAEKSPTICDLRTADQLSPHHDSQFSSWFKLGHNRSSSPFTTLADVAERRVASTGAGQPNYWPKTWFGANPYNAKFGVPNYTYKKCSDFCCHNVGCYKAPGKHQNVPKCTGATWWGYPQGNWKKE